MMTGVWIFYACVMGLCLSLLGFTIWLTFRSSRQVTPDPESEDDSESDMDPVTIRLEIRLVIHMDNQNQSP